MKGEVTYLYAFDVANEIITSRVHEILSARPFPFEIRMDRTLPKDMPLYKPLAIEPPPLVPRRPFCRAPPQQSSARVSFLVQIPAG